MKDQKTRDLFIDLRACGQSFDKIAATLGVSKQTLINWSRTHKLELDNAKAIARDAQLRRHELHEQGRIELIGDLLKRLREEAMSRDLSGIETDRLFELLLKLSKSAAAIESSLVLRTIDPNLDFLSGINEASWEA